MRSSRLSRAVLEQTGGHPALRETPPEARPRLAGDREQDDTLPIEREVDGRSWMEPDPVTQVLGDDDLSLGANSMSHTSRVLLGRCPTGRYRTFHCRIRGTSARGDRLPGVANNCSWLPMRC